MPLLVLGLLMLLGVLILIADQIHQERRFQLAMEMVDHGEYGRAEPYLRARVADDPDDLDARVALARALAGREAFGEALGHLEHVVEREPERTGVQRLLGEIHRALGDIEQAARHLETATVQAPDDGRAWLLLAEVRLEHGRAIEAETAARRALDAGGPPARGQAVLGRALCAQDRALEGLGVLDAALAAWPESADVHLALAEVHRARGSHGLAVERYREAQRLGARGLALDLGLAAALQGLGAYDEAVRELERTTHLHEREPEPWYRLGLVREDLDDAPGALACYKRCLALDGGHAEARARAEALRRTLGR